METITERVRAIKKEMALYGRQWGHEVKLIAVTKNRPPEEISQLINADHFDIGENRVSEVLEKQPVLRLDFRIHMIGQLQTNKVKYIMDKVCQIQSVDRISLADEVNRRALRSGSRMSILVEVSPAGEAQKGGILMKEAAGFIRTISRYEGLRVNGLMAVMPLTDDQAYLDGLFQNVRALFDSIRSEAIEGVQMTDLSMGMSNDYKLALLRGSNVIRIGTAIFGTGR